MPTTEKNTARNATELVADPSLPQDHPPSVSQTVLLLGATGFIGSYVLRALLDAGIKVIAVRRQHASRSAVPAQAQAEAGGQLSWRYMQAQRMLSSADWTHLLQAEPSITVVINCVGILRQRIGERYEEVHHLMPAALAQACAQSSPQRSIRLIHTSALGLHEQAKSRFLSSKLLGEQAIAASGADYCIVRPSLIDGMGGFGASWLRMLARWPVHFVPRGATGKIAAVQASDLGLAYVKLAQMSSLSQQRQANLGGQRLFAYGEYLQLLRGVETSAADTPQIAGALQPQTTPALQVMLPNWVSRIGSHMCDLFRFSPFSYGHWILLQRDNVPIPNALPTLLGRPPLPVGYTQIKMRDDFRLS